MTDEVKKKMGDVINLLCAELGFTKPIDILRCSAAVTDLYHDLEKQNELLRKYITRGGFIQDCHGKWCKEGDKIKFTPDNPNSPKADWFQGVIKWSDGKTFYAESCNKKRPYRTWLGLTTFELIEPCEPDVCKDFEGE